MTGDPTIAARLRQARLSAGYETAREAYDDFDHWRIDYGGYVHHENGTRAFSISDAVDYCDKYDVNLDWLADGRGPMREGAGRKPVDDDLLDLHGLNSEAKEQIRNLANVLRRIPAE